MAWPLAPDVLDLLRHHCTIVSTATHRNLVTGAVTPLDILDGSVTVDRTAAIRRTLNLTVPALQATFDVLDTPGGEITVRQTIKHPSGVAAATVPLGVFIVDQDQFGYGPGDTLTMTCPDRWLKVQRARFGLNRSSVASNAAWQEIQRLVEGAWPSPTYPFPGWTQLDTSATTKVGSLLWDDGDREAAIVGEAGIARANALEVFFDAQGAGVLRPVPQLTPTSTPVWVVNANTPDSVMTAASRTRDWSSVRNAVIVTSSASDVIFAPVEVKNTTPGDPLNVDGPLGYRPYEYSSPAIRNSTQARAAGLVILSQQLGEAKQLTVEAVSNPALDAEDVILAMLPKIDRNTARPSELHIIDSVTHPLVQNGSQTQPILTRSTRPATDGA